MIGAPPQNSSDWPSALNILNGQKSQWKAHENKTKEL
jgi:hypothetical protein